MLIEWSVNYCQLVKKTKERKKRPGSTQINEDKVVHFVEKKSVLSSCVFVDKHCRFLCAIVGKGEVRRRLSKK